MRKIILLALALTASGLYAQNVDEQELKKRSLDGVEFINYVGPHRYVNSKEEILAIGRSLASGVKTTDKFTLGDKYSVQRIYKPTQEGLSADLLFLLPSAGVDHIRNLNSIVAGYLEVTFSYTPAQAQLVADFVTRYNVLLRENYSEFTGTYSQGVKDSLEPKTAGLSRLFSDWPGRTRLVIPLMGTLAKGPQGQVDTDTISRKEVVDPLSKETEGLNLRKDLANLKEQEIAQEQAAVDKKEEQIAAKETQVADQEKQLAALEEQAKKDPQAREETQAQREVLRETIAQEKEQIAQERQNLEEKKDQLEQREENLTQERQEVAQAQREQAQNETGTPAVKEETPAAQAQIPQDSVALLGITDQEGQYSRIVVLDPKNFKVLRKSGLNSIRGRKLEDLGTVWAAVAGSTGASGVVKLVLIDKRTLEVTKESTEEVSASTLLVKQGNNLLAVYKKSDGTWVLGAFSETLALGASSDFAVVPGTPVNQRADSLIVQASDGKFTQMDPRTLKKTGDFRE